MNEGLLSKLKKLVASVFSNVLANWIAGASTASLLALRLENVPWPLALGIVLPISVLVAIAWSIVANRRIRRAAAAAPRMKLTFDKSRNRQVFPESERILYRITASLTGRESVPWMSCQLKEISALDSVCHKVRHDLHSMQGRHLHKKDDPFPFSQRHALSLVMPIEFDVIEESHDRDGTWQMWFGFSGDAHPKVPAGKYRLKIVAYGEGAAEADIVLIVEKNMAGRLVVNEEMR